MLHKKTVNSMEPKIQDLISVSKLQTSFSVFISTEDKQNERGNIFLTNMKVAVLKCIWSRWHYASGQEGGRPKV